MAYQDFIKKRQELIRKMNQQRQMNDYRENQRKMNGLNTAKNINSLGYKTINMGDNLKSYGKALDTVGNKLGNSSNQLAQGLGDTAKGLGNKLTAAGDKANLLKTGITKNVSESAIGNGAKAVGNKVAQSAVGQGLKAGASKLATSAAGKALTGAASKLVGAAAGPIGWGLMGAKMIYDIFNSAKQKRDMKAMAESQRVANEALVNNKEQVGSIIQENMNNQNELQNKMNDIKANMNQPELQQGYEGELPEIANYQNNNQPTLNQGEQQMNPENQGLINKLIGAIRGDELSPGQAAPVLQPQAPLEGPTLDPNAGAAQDNTNIVSSILGRLKEGASGLTDKIPNVNIGQGLRDLNSGYQDNVKTSFTQGDLYNRMSGGKLPDESVQAGEQVTPTNGIIEGGTAQNDSKVSNIMSKIGELAGTAQRTLSRPMVQGAIASGIAAANGNDIGTALEYGFNWGKDKAISDRYSNLINPDAAPSLLGGYTNEDYNSYLSKLKNDREIDKEAYTRQRQAEQDELKQKNTERELSIKERDQAAKENAGYYTRGYGRNNSRQAGYSNPRNDKYELENLIRYRDDAKAQNDERMVQHYQDQINQMGGYVPQEQPANNVPAQGGNWISNIINNIKQQGAEAQNRMQGNYNASNTITMIDQNTGKIGPVPLDKVAEAEKYGYKIYKG